MTRSKDRIAVIGAGPGGLAAAALLSAKGYDVSIIEARENIGGRNGRLQLGEFGFDIGPTFLMMPGLLADIFERCGARMSDHLKLTRLDPMYKLYFPDDTSFAAVDNRERMQAALRTISDKDAEAYPKYYDYMNRKLAALMPILSTPYFGPKDLLSMDILRAAPFLRPDRNLMGELRSFFEAEHSHLIFGFQAKYLGMSPFETPSIFSILNFIEQKYGVWHPQGGLNEIPKALASLATSRGATLRIGMPVERVNVTNGRITGMVAGGEEIKADHYIVNADLTDFLQKNVTPADRKKYTDQKLDSLKYSCSTYMLYLGVDGEVDLPHHNFVFSRDYKTFLSQLSTTGELPKDPSYYLCNASSTDPTLAPKGKSSVYLLAPVPNLKIGSIDWATQRERFRETLLSSVRERLGLDVTGRIQVESELDPVRWRDQYHVAHGAVFNLKHSLDQMLFFRPRNRFEEFENMYLVGGSTHPGSGLPTIFRSAQIACDLISGEKPHPLSA